ncbi:UPF0758 protein [Clostridia bacterium]|nr:UPF0758 protein [Clostridia bacterium]
MQKDNEKNVHIGHRERMRERYIESGIFAFSDHEIIEFLLYFAIPQRDTNALAHKMLAEFGSLHNLMDTHPLEISRRCGVSMSCAILLTIAPQVHKRYAESKMKEKIFFSNTKDVGNYLVSLFAAETSECFYMLCFDTRQRLIAPALISRGTIDKSQIYIRQVAEAALKFKAASVVLSHNHPNNDLEPSPEDLDATAKIVSALDALDIETLDHVIVNAANYFSFRESGLI